MALLTIDEYRVESRRDGICCCVVHSIESEKIKLCPDQSKLFKGLAETITKGPVKCLVAASTVLLLIIGAFGLKQLKMEFRPEWLMDPGAEGRNFR